MRNPKDNDKLTGGGNLKTFFGFDGSVLPHFASCLNGQSLKLWHFQLPKAKPLNLKVVRISGSVLTCKLVWGWKQKIEDQHEGTRFVFGHPRCAKLKARS